MKYRIIAGAICISVTLSGCGSFAGRHGIDAGFAYIDSHEYAKALASFEKAEEDGEDACLVHRGKGIAYLYSDKDEEAAQDYLDIKNGGRFDWSSDENKEKISKII